MRKSAPRWLRRAYRILIKNTFIRYTWLLALAIFGTYQCSEYRLFKREKLFEKSFLNLSNSDTIISFAIQKKDSELQFTHTERGWFVVENPISIALADSLVEPFLHILSTLKVVGLQPDSLTKNRLRILLNLKNGQNIAFWIDESLKKEAFTPIQRCNENQVLLTKMDLYPLVDLDIHSFRNRTLTDFEAAKLLKVKWQRGDSVWQCVHEKNNVWQYENSDNFLLRQDSLNVYLQTVAQLKGEKFYDHDRDFLPKKYEQQRLTFYLRNDTVQLTHYFQNNRHLLTSSDNSTAFFQMDSVQMAVLMPRFLPQRFLYPKPKTRKSLAVEPKTANLTE